MPTTRVQSFSNVKDAYVAAKTAAISTAALSARCAAVLFEEHDRARLHPETGAEAIALISQAADHARKARECIMLAHPLLRAIPEDFGVPKGYGFDETYEDKPKAEHLKVVG